MLSLNAIDMKTPEISVDKTGAIFLYKGRVFRAINDSHIDTVKRMFKSGLIQGLIEKRLFPNTWVSDVEINGYSYVLEHENIEHWNYPYEWSFDMLKDAALVVLEVNKIANKHGYEIYDGHAFNVAFNMSQPQYCDLGSFIDFNRVENKSWKGYKIFYCQFYVPLYLWSKGYSEVARNIFLMRDYFRINEFLKIKYPIINFLGGNFIFSMLEKVMGVSLLSESRIKENINNPFIKKIVIIISSIFNKIYCMDSMVKEIEQTRPPIEKSMWHNYQNKIDDPVNNKRFLRVADIINTLKGANSLIELAANQGRFSSYIIDNTKIDKVIATDYDREAVNIMYLNNKGRDDFLPLLFDMILTNGRKYDAYIYERIKSDIVVALAVTHHLILSQHIPIEFIFKTMKKLTKKYIIVEFMPLGLYAGDIDKTPSLPDFYNLSWFKSEFINHFDLMLDEVLEINRHVFVGKIKRGY